MTDSTAEIYWSGSSVKITFRGSSVRALLRDKKGANYFNIIIDEDSIRILKLAPSKKEYILAEGLPSGKHVVELFKRTEWTHGQTEFLGFLLDGNSKMLPAARGKGKIVFYGNSITCGYAVDNQTGGDSPDSVYTNCYNSYAAMTARHFKADYNIISRSGIGVMVSWFDQIMPEMYDLLNPGDPGSRWDFSGDTTDIVVVNLLQNDSWLVNKPDNAQFQRRFGQKPPERSEIVRAYANFIGKLRDVHPGARIICMLGNMDITRPGSPWPGYVREAVSSLGDKRIHTLFIPYKNSPGHPRAEEQKVMADSLIARIEQLMKW